MTKNSWFSARLLFESKHPDEPDCPKVYEDRIVLLVAEDEVEAAKKANSVGSKSREEYLNQFGARVMWDFLEVLDLVAIDQEQIAHGSEVYSQLLNEEDLVAVRRSLRPGKLGDEAPAG
jgi:hypothetical protein